MLHKIYFFFLLILFSLEAHSSELDDIKIYSNEFFGKDTIDFGVTYIGDAVFQTIIIENNSDRDVFFSDVDPSILIEPSDYSPYPQTNDSAFQHAFLDNPTNLGVIRSNTSKEILIRFKPFYYYNDRNLNETGYFEARLKLGVLEKIDTNKSIVEKFYILVGRSTVGYLSSVKPIIDFDSVMIRPPSKIISNLRIRNNWVQSIQLIDDDFEVLTTKQNFNEFEIEQKTTPIDIVQKNILEYDLSYYPIDNGFDHARYSATYLTEEQESGNDSLAFFDIDIYGYGVQQNLHLSNVISYDWIHNNDRDTIDMGEIYFEDIVELNATLINNGNLNFGIPKTEEIININNVSASIDTPLNNRSITLGSNVEFSLLVSPDDYGEFEFTYSIPSDINQRAISGLLDYHNSKDVVIKGIGLAPDMRINIQNDTIDFGSISSNDNCTQFTEQTFKIYNQGNAELILDNIGIRFENLQTNSFEFTPSVSKISSGTFSDLNIRFIPSISGNYSATVTMKINQPNEYKNIYLIGSSTDDIQKNIKVSSIKTRPGNMVSIPILFNNNSINIASKFKAELNYSLSHLDFINAETINTASENSSNNPETFFIQNENGLDISINMNTGETFKRNDTLVILNFNTYLGESITSQIELSNPKFGNKDCEDLFLLNSPEPGLFEIIGISNKNKKAFKNQSLIQSIYPNPSQGEFRILSRSNINDIKLFNQFGEMMVFNFIQNNDIIVMNVPKINTGVYFLSVRKGSIVETQEILFIK